MSLNTATLHGNLGGDPELKQSNSGKSYATFSIATSDGWGDNKKTNWHRCTAFGKPAELINQYAKKGDEIVVRGSIDYNKHEDKIYTSILVNDFSFCKNDKSGGGKAKDKYDPEKHNDLPFKGDEGDLEF